MNRVLSIAFAVFCFLSASAQPNVHPASKHYVPPADPLVSAKLEKWKDQKFGIIIHWGLYAVPGIIESWSLCSEDWITRDSMSDYGDYKKWYWGLKNQFNPVNFDPAAWASTAAKAGMKYLVFTTKHHDGFSMFDTKQSDFSIRATPFAGDSRMNVAKHVFDAFRNEGFMIGAYFSKPDWHNTDYWWPHYATADRNNNYDIRKFPWRWERFKKFTHAQIEELMRDYGSMDILWLDGGWVRPLETVNDEVRSWGAAIPAWSQDIDMPRLASMARGYQPGLLLVDRTVHGPYENYLTPEQRVPDEPLPFPWESCITLGGAWGFVPNDQYKPAAKVIQQLIDVVAKGGSLLLGIGPDAKGQFPDTVNARLLEIGQWMEKNGEAIYETRAVDAFKSGDTYFTKKKDGSAMYALTVYPNGIAADEISWQGLLPRKGSKMLLLQTGQVLKWSIKDGKLIVKLPKGFSKKYPNIAATAIRFEAAND
ncbi:MAG: alpha-L-fucosidase [Chitinophagaceae bacterium]